MGNSFEDMNLRYCVIIIYSMNAPNSLIRPRISSNIYGVNLKRNDEEFLYFMLSILNSNIAWYFVKSTSAGLRGGYFQYKTKYVEPMPIPDFEDLKKTNKEQIKTLISNTKMILKSGGNDELEAKNDEIVYHLFGLTKAEAAQVVSETKGDYRDSPADDELDEAA